MKKDVMRIYYGNYAIENRLPTKALSNEIQLKALLLLSNRVLILLIHFLKISNENLEDFFESEKSVLPARNSKQRKEFSSILLYFAESE